MPHDQPDRRRRLLEQNVDARVVMEILGHSLTSLTSNTYEHVMPKIITDATELVGGALFAPVATTVAPCTKS